MPAVNSVNPLASSHSPPDTYACYYEDIDSHEYAVLEQTLSLPPNPQREARSQSNVCLSSTAVHQYAILTGPLGRMPDIVMTTQRDNFSNSIPDTRPGTIPDYATLEPEQGVVTPASVEYSKLYTSNHDYQRVLPDPSFGYDRTFAKI